MNVAALVAWGLLAVAADPSVPGLALDWSAPEGCPASAEVVDLVRSKVGPGHPGGALTVHGRVVELAPSKWEVSLATESRAGKGERSIEAGDCREATQAAALVIALALDEAARERVPVTGQVEAPPPPARGWTYLVRPAVEGSLAGFPTPASAVSLSVAASSARWRVELGARHGFSQTLVAGSGPGGGTLDLLIGGDLRLCRLWQRGTLEPLACVGATGGVEQGRGVDIRAPRAAVAPFAGGAVSGGLGWRLSRVFWVHAELEAALIGVRPSFVIQNQGQVYQVPWFVPAASVGVEARFP